MNPIRTLFLDRDGVINEKRENDYVKTLSEWVWRKDFLETIPLFTQQFDRIVIVTNQRGIALKKMTENDLAIIHNSMLNTIHSLNGKIDGIFYCPHDKTAQCDCRKPKTGLCLQAKNKFPEIEFKNSILIGDSESDIEMGNTLDMQTVLLTSNLKTTTQANHVITSLSSLKNFVTL